MDKAVYVLGAGYSAPLGLPGMLDFLAKAKDLYFLDPGRFEYFNKVFSGTQGLAMAKNYHTADLFNIEDILSLLEMQRQLQGRRLQALFTRLLTGVVLVCTPPIAPYPGQLPWNWGVDIFGKRRLVNQYGSFVASLFGIQIEKRSVVDYGNGARRDSHSLCAATGGRSGASRRRRYRSFAT